MCQHSFDCPYRWPINATHLISTTEWYNNQPHIMIVLKIIYKLHSNNSRLREIMHKQNMRQANNHTNWIMRNHFSTILERVENEILKKMNVRQKNMNLYCSFSKVVLNGILLNFAITCTNLIFAEPCTCGYFEINETLIWHYSSLIKIF